jgi:hypothetical protein
VYTGVRIPEKAFRPKFLLRVICITSSRETVVLVADTNCLVWLGSGLDQRTEVELDYMKILDSFSRGAFLVLAAGISIACQQPIAAVNPSPNIQPNAPLPNAAAQNPPIPNPEDGIPRVRPEEAKAAFEKGTAIIVDVRGPDAYKAAHIKGAIEHSLSRLEQGDFKDLPKNKRIIAYCS